MKALRAALTRSREVKMVRKYIQHGSSAASLNVVGPSAPLLDASDENCVLSRPQDLLEGAEAADRMAMLQMSLQLFMLRRERERCEAAMFCAIAWLEGLGDVNVSIATPNKSAPAAAVAAAVSEQDFAYDNAVPHPKAEQDTLNVDPTSTPLLITGNVGTMPMSHALALSLGIQRLPIARPSSSSLSVVASSTMKSAVPLLTSSEVSESKMCAPVGSRQQQQSMPRRRQTRSCSSHEQKLLQARSVSEVSLCLQHIIQGGHELQKSVWRETVERLEHEPGFFACAVRYDRWLRCELGNTEALLRRLRHLKKITGEAAASTNAPTPTCEPSHRHLVAAFEAALVSCTTRDRGSDTAVVDTVAQCWLELERWYPQHAMSSTTIRKLIMCVSRIAITNNRTLELYQRIKSKIAENDVDQTIQFPALVSTAVEECDGASNCLDEKEKKPHRRQSKLQRVRNER